MSTPPKWCDTHPWYLISHRHMRAIPHFATYRAMIVRYPIKTSAKQFCDTVATSIARYKRYRCWASKFHTRVRGTMFVRSGAVTPGPSRECDITFFVIRDDQNLRDNRVTVQWWRAGCRASPYRHPGCHANVVPPG